MRFFLRWVAIALATAVAILLIPGIYTIGTDGTLAIVLFALVLALINATLKPIAQLLGLPISILTLGIFYLVVNGLLLMLASWISTTVFASGVVVEGLTTAVFGSIVISIVSAIVNSITGANEE
jgi:putative membrane protein